MNGARWLKYVFANTSRSQGRVLGLALIVSVVALCLGISSGLAIADEPSSQPGAEMPLLPSGSGAQFEPDTNPAAAEILPKQDLDREEAEELLDGVFGEELEVPADFFDELDVDAFRADNVALVDPPAASAPAGLLSSTLPLRAENDSGEKSLIDLTLQQEGAGLEPRNSLVDVSIPSELSDGISIPIAGVGVRLSSVNGERSASQVGDATAFYPNVRPETDVAITAVPTGVETYTQLRSPAAPRQEAFELTLPSGAALTATKSGGAEVVAADGKVLLSVPAPWAMDAKGDQVPTQLAVEGNSIVVSVDPPASASYPILLDPIFESYNFNYATGPGTAGKEWSGAYNDGFRTNWGSPAYGMDAISLGGMPTSPGNQAMFNYYVPRYWTDIQAGQPKPLSYIRNMKLWNLAFMEPYETSYPAQNRAAYPFMQLGLWDENHNQFVWRMVRYGNEGQWTDGSYVFNMTNPNENPDVKHGGFAIATLDSGFDEYRYVNVQQASVEVTDQDLPGWQYMPSPSGWMNQTPKPIEYSVSDYGLGIYSLRVDQPAASGGTKSVTTSNGCVGTAGSPCPRTATNTTRSLSYEPASMAQGENTLAAYALDPVSNASAQKLVKAKVDHTAPQVSLSGSLTEQPSVGTKLPEYTLNYNASDGDDAAAAAQAPFGAQGTAQGQLERPNGVAVDASGNVWIADSWNNRIVELDRNGGFVRQVGSFGAAAGQFNGPRGIAVAPNGTVWVADYGNHRLQAFTSQGVFIRQVTPTDQLKLEGPWAIAAAKDGSVWVSDVTADRIRHYSETGAYLGNAPDSTLANVYGLAIDSFGNIWASDYSSNKVYEYYSNGVFKFSFGSEGTGNGQFKGPQGVAIAPSGNVFVADEGNGRIQELKPDGTFLRQFGSLGAASDQLSEPKGLAVGPGNTLYVGNAGSRRVSRWAHADQDPQSGVAKLEVKVDGAIAKSTAPGCSTKNCSISGSWTLDANSYSAGLHKVDVIATDGVGLPATKTVNVETHGDLVAPGVALSGSMTEQATVGTTRTTYKLKVSATDTGAEAERKSGVVATTIKVDGNLVDSYNAPCATEGCAVTREWVMQSSEYLGPHEVVVAATDGVGRVTTKKLSITINKDVTPPKISTGTEAFFTQPQNWLVQKSYGYTTSATDENASGVASFQFKIDGALIKQAYGTCAGGSCSKTLTGEINILSYAGGAHAAELVATDIAGNVAKKAWTMNVDPEGHIAASEVTDTLEAVEDTAPQATEGLPVDGLVTEVVGEEGSNPKLVQKDGELVSSGTPTPTSVSLDPQGGFSIDTSAVDQQGATSETNVEVVPVNVSTGAGAPQITDGSAAVIANSRPTVDTVLRPAYDGLMAFQDIRDSAGPETYSWEVRLGEGEALKLIDDKHAGVFWEDGTLAMLITAQSAHDADGKAVTTAVSVSGEKFVTLTVHHRVPGVTYPVVAGVGYEGGFQTVEASGPPPTEQKEEPDYLEGLAWTVQVSPPEPIAADDPEGQAEASSNLNGLIKKWGVRACPNDIVPIFDECGVWNVKFKGFYYYNFKKAWYPANRSPQCDPFGAVNYSLNMEECAWVGPNNQWYGDGYHITARAQWTVTAGYGVTAKSSHKAIVGRAYGSGNIYFGDTSNICNPSKPECV
jgi:sugar lactone lactonase YvrE